MTIATILIYLAVSGFVTVYVGRVLYTNGRHFIIMMLNDENVADSVNRILLLGYYLLNLGYVSVMLTLTPIETTLHELISSLSMSIGRIILTLGIIHYINIAVITWWNKMNIHKNKSI